MKTGLKAAAFWRIAAAGGLALALLAGAVLTAQAHATYLRSEPADNSVVETAPSQIKIWFTEPVATDFSTAQVLDLNGQQVAVRVLFDPTDPTLMVLMPPALANGVYTVNWRAASASDGHQSNGYFVFRVGAGTVGAGAGAAGSSGQSSEAPISVPEALLRWLNYSGLLLMVGALGAALVVLRPGEAALDAFYRRVTRRVFVLAALAAAFIFSVGLLYLAWQLASLTAGGSGSIAPEAALTQILFATTWGYAWIARQALAAALIPVFTRLAQAGRPLKLWTGLAAALTAAALAAQAVTSHAAGGSSPKLPLAVDFLHLVFVGLWVGGIFCLAVGILPALNSAAKEKLDFKQVAGATWGRFGPLAAVSVGMVIATGIYSTGQRVISADALLLTSYGLVLVGKIGLMLLAGLFGLANSLVLHPGLAAPLGRLLRRPPGWTPSGAQHLPAFIITEAALGALIVLVVGGLTTLAPASQIQYAISPGQQPDQLTAEVKDMIIGLSIKPDRPGPNIFNILAASSLRPAPAEVLRVIVNMTYLEQDFGTVSQDAQPAGTSAYRLSADALTQPGRWKIAVVVRRKGIPDTTADFTWTVLPVGNAQAPLVSRVAWKDGLTLLAGLMGGAVLLVAVFVVVRRRRSPGPARPPATDRPRPAESN
jgi:copper transport protein